MQWDNLKKKVRMKQRYNKKKCEKTSEIYSRLSKLLDEIEASRAIDETELTVAKIGYSKPKDFVYLKVRLKNGQEITLDG